MKKRTTQLLAQLKQLATSAAENVYERIELSAQVLGDLEWIASVHGGSDLKAQDALQSQYFADLGGFISLGKLLQMQAKIPKERWAEARFDIAAVEALYDEEYSTREVHEKANRTSWKAIAEQRGEDIERLEREVKQIGELAESRASELERLRRQVEQLQSDNARLEGRVEELQRLCNQAA